MSRAYRSHKNMAVFFFIHKGATFQLKFIFLRKRDILYEGNMYMKLTHQIIINENCWCVCKLKILLFFFDKKKSNLYAVLQNLNT